MTDNVMIAAARKLGETAARLGHPVTACPYRPGSQHAIERAAARAYVTGWLHWSPSAPSPNLAGDGDGDAGDVDEEDHQAARSAAAADLVDELLRHYTGRHDQKNHGRRYKIPGDRKSGLRELKNALQGKKAAGDKPAAAAPAKKAPAGKADPVAEVKDAALAKAAAPAKRTRAKAKADDGNFGAVRLSAELPGQGTALYATDDEKRRRRPGEARATAAKHRAAGHDGAAAAWEENATVYDLAIKAAAEPDGLLVVKDHVPSKAGRWAVIDAHAATALFDTQDQAESYRKAHGRRPPADPAPRTADADRRPGSPAPAEKPAAAASPAKFTPGDGPTAALSAGADHPTWGHSEEIRATLRQLAADVKAGRMHGGQAADRLEAMADDRTRLAKNRLYLRALAGTLRKERELQKSRDSREEAPDLEDELSPAVMHQGIERPAGWLDAAELSVKKWRGKWDVVGAPGQSFGTKREAEAFILQSAKTRREWVDAERRTENARLKNGRELVGPADLRPGDVYIDHPTNGKRRTVTKVDALESGATMVYHEKTDADDMGFLLLPASDHWTKDPFKVERDRRPDAPADQVAAVKAAAIEKAAAPAPARVAQLADGGTVDVPPPGVLRKIATTKEQRADYPHVESINDLSPGDVVFMSAHGDYRRGVVTGKKRSNVTVAYTTETSPDSVKTANTSATNVLKHNPGLGARQAEEARQAGERAKEDARRRRDAEDARRRQDADESAQRRAAVEASMNQQAAAWADKEANRRGGKPVTPQERADLAKVGITLPDAPAPSALAGMSAEDEQRIRNAVADRGPGIFTSPAVGGSKSDVGRYLAEGELGKQLAERHDWRTVWKAVREVVDENPAVLDRTPAQAKADAEARAASVKELVDQAQAAVKTDKARAVGLLDKALAIDPDAKLTEGGRAGYRLSEVRASVAKALHKERQAAQEDDSAAELTARRLRNARQVGADPVAALKEHAIEDAKDKAAAERRGPLAALQDAVQLGTFSREKQEQRREQIGKASAAHDRVTSAKTEAAYQAALANEAKVQREIRQESKTPATGPRLAAGDKVELDGTPGTWEVARVYPDGRQVAIVDPAKRPGTVGSRRVVDVGKLRPAGSPAPAAADPVAAVKAAALAKASAAVELTVDGAETAFVPGARSTIGLGDRPQVGRKGAPEVQLGLFADLAAESKREMEGQGALLDALLNPQQLADDFLDAGKGGKR